jgi:hypothetical protein
MRLLLRGFLVGLSVGVFAVAVTTPSSAIVQTFAGFPAGTVAAGDLPGGGTAPGTLFPDFTVSVVNNSGPQSLIIFDSANPTGEDPDLGTPNQTCPGGGPGVGIGGQVGQPGENCVPLGNLLIIAEDIVDGNLNGLVDDPDDDLNGGTITFTWNSPTSPTRIILMDIDNESAAVSVSNNTLLVTVDATDLGDNSAQTIDLTGYPATDKMVVRFSSSGAVAEIEYDVAVQTHQRSWGSIKGIYR